MKRLLYVVNFLVLFTFLTIINVSAKECTATELRQLKALAKKVEIGYEYDGNFKLSVYNLNNKLQINVGMEFIQKDTKNFDTCFLGQKCTYEVYPTNDSPCQEEMLREIILRFPTYNRFYDYKECDGNYTLDICKKWYDTTQMTDDDFFKILESNNKNENFRKSIIDLIINFIKTYYLLFIVFVVLVIVVILLLVVTKKRKNKYKLDL